MKRLHKPILFWLGTLVLGLLVMSGCQPAQKPTEPEQVVVPEVTKVFFEEVEAAQAPPVVRDLAERFTGEEAQLALVADNNVWVVVTKEDDTEELAIKEVVKRVVGEKASVLEVRLLEKDSEDKEKNNEPLIARFNVDDLSSGVVFYEEEEPKKEAGTKEATPSSVSAAPPVKTSNVKAQTQAPKETTPSQGAGEQTLEVDSVQAGAGVSSPLEVSGTARGMTGVIKLRLRDGEGNILAETETTANKEGKFQGILNYEKPQNPLKGRLEVFMLQNGQEKNMRVIPVTIR